MVNIPTPDVLPTSIAVTGAMMSWLPQLTDIAQLLAALVAIAAGGIALVGWWNKRRKSLAQGPQPAPGPIASLPAAPAPPADSTKDKVNE